MNLKVYILSSISFSVLGVLSVTADDHCSQSQILDVQNEPGYISFTEYPRSYSNNLTCSWQLVNRHQDAVTMLEFQSFSIESFISCTGDRLRITHGNKSSVKCGHKKRFFMKISDESVDITFTANDKYITSGFKLKYYSLPDYKTTCENSTAVKIMASRNRSRFVSASFKSCQWEITADQPSDVIVLEILESNQYATRYWTIKISESINNERVKLSGLVDLITRYYRSASNRIVVKLINSLGFLKQSQNIEVILSFYSIQNDLFPKDEMQVDYIPLYFYIPPYNHNKRYLETPEFNLSTSGGCIQTVLLSSSMSDLNVALTEYFYIYDGDSTAATLIKDVCMVESNSVKGQFRKMLIQQKRNSFTKGTWLVVKKSRSCGSKVDEMILYDTKTIQTLNYPKPIIGNINCRWEIIRHSNKRNKLIYLRAYPADNKTIDSSKNPTCYRGLDINYGYSSTYLHKYFWWCMDTVQQFVMDKSSFYITLNSRTSTVKPFKLVMSLEENKYRGNKCKKSIVSYLNESVDIISPFFHGGFAGAMDCTWEVHAKSKYHIIKLTVNSLLLDVPNRCSDSKLEIQDTTMDSPIVYCHSISVPTTTEFHGNMNISFVRHATSFEGGFNATVKSYDLTKPCNGEWIVADTEPQYLVISSELKKMYEPCHYKIMAPKSGVNIIVETMLYDLGDCWSNKILFYDGQTANTDNQLGTLCGSSHSHTRTTFTAESGFVFINFDSNTEAIIKLKYFAERKDARYILLNATPYLQYFTSPNYPYNYQSNRNYTWRIDTVRGNTIRLDVIDCFLGYQDRYGKRDRVIVYDGNSTQSNRILGEFYNEDTGKTFKSTESSLIVVLVSVVKAKTVRQGFRFGYIQFESPKSEKSSGNSSTAVIVFSCIGVIVFLGLSGLFIYCFTCRRKKPARNPSTDHPPPYHSHPAYTISSGTSTGSTVFSPPPAYELNDHLPDVPPPSYEEAAKYEIKFSSTEDSC